MPNLEAKHLPIWLTYCSNAHFTGELQLATHNMENIILQVISGKCTATNAERKMVLSARSILMLGRSTSTLLECATDQTSEYILLRYEHAYTRMHLDLNHLCLKVSLIDSFLGRKDRFCLLNDNNCIYLTMGALQYEWNNNEPEKEQMILPLLRELFIKLARSFHARHNDAAGINYISLACNFIQNHYQQPLSLNDIAEYAGISRSYLTILFRKYMERSVVDYIQAVRCDHASYLLNTTHFSTTGIAMETGFNNRQHFARTFMKIYGTSPQKYRNEHHIQ